MNAGVTVGVPARRPTARDLSRTLGRLLVGYAVTASVGAWLGAHLLCNLTPSMPLGLYWLGAPSGTPRRGDLVALPVPASVRPIVRERRYLAEGRWLLKPIAGLPGDRVCAADGVLAIDGAPFGAIATADSRGRPLPHYDECRALAGDEAFVVSSHARSFDSRVFGPIPLASIQGTVTPLWTF